MRDLPAAIIHVLRQFEPLFSERVWEWAKILLVGAILAPGKRTVTSALRVMGLSGERQFQNFHRVLNRAHWSSRGASCVLLRLLVAAFVPAEGAVVIGVDDHIERRRGAQIAAKGIYRDAVWSSKAFFVKTSGAQRAPGWVCMMGASPVGTVRVGVALLDRAGTLCALLSGARVRYKLLTDWTRQMIIQVRSWLPNRILVVVADSGCAALELLAACQGLLQPVAMVTRLRLDAALYDPAPLRTPSQRGRPRKKGARQPTLATRVDDPATIWTEHTVTWYGRSTRTVRWVLITDPDGKFRAQALLCTDPKATATQMVEWLVLRWQLEVTFEEARTHLGIETQRQWSDLAILRSTPALFSLYSLVTLFAHQLLHGQPLPARQAAWYTKEVATFADTLAFVRQQLWPVTILWMSPSDTDVIQIPKALFDRLADTLAFPA